MAERSTNDLLEARDFDVATVRQLIDTAARDSRAIALSAPGRAPLSYDRLARHIDVIVLALAASGVMSRQRVALVMPSGPELAVMILALAGPTVCVPLNPSHRADEFDFYFSTLGAAAVIVQADLDSPAREAARKHAIPLVELTPCRESEAGTLALSCSNVEGFQPKNVDVVPDDIALIQYTSGSTAWPKRVPLTHRNVTESVSNLAAALKLTPRDCCLNLKPLYHGAGLQTMLAALAAGGMVVCPPLPDVDGFFGWLEEFRPTWFAAAPPTHRAILSRAQGYRASISRCPLRFIRSGTGPLAPDTLRELERVFGVPVLEGYGMTETGEISCPPLPPQPRKYGSVGVTVGPEVAIMDENGIPVAPGGVGEVVVRGATVTRGYEDAREANAEAFRDGWFRTGDLGVLDADRYLFLKGRLKDLVNRGGEKVSPHEVEETLHQHPAVADTVAFAVPHPTLGQDLAAAVVPHSGCQITELDLRQFLAHRLADFKVPSRVLVVGDILKGPTGKIQRQSLAEHFRSLLRPPFVPPKDPVEEALARIWADELEVDHIGIDDNFFEVGGDSLSAVRVCERVQSSLGRPLSVDMLFKTPTVAELAKILQHPDAGRQAPSCLVAIKAGGTRPPLFCLHTRDGTVFRYSALAGHLGPDQPVYGIQARGVDGTQPLLTRFDDMAALYVREIQAVFPHGPYLLCGYSLGGLLAWEVARHLHARNRQVALLALFDTPLDLNPSSRPVAQSGWRFFTRRVTYHVEALKESRLPWPSYVALRLKARWTRLHNAVAERSAEPDKDDGEPHAWWVLPGDEPEKWPASLLTMVETNSRAGREYRLRRYPGRVNVFLAREAGFRRYDPRLPGRLAGGGVEIRWAPGNHAGMLFEPHVSVLAKALRNCIDKAIVPAPHPWHSICPRLTSRVRP